VSGFEVIVFLASQATLVMGGAFLHWVFTSDPSTHTQCVSKRTANKIERDLDDARLTVGESLLAMKTLAAERDKYLEIAKSREMKPVLAIDQSKEVITQLWKSRRHRATIGENLKRLETELLPYKDKTVTVALMVRGEIGWWHYTLLRANKGIRSDADLWGKSQRFTGTPEWVIREIVLSLTSTRGGFLVRGNRVAEWEGSESPITFETDVQLREPAETAKLPIVQLVPVVESVKTEVVEVHVYRDREIARELNSEEIEALVKARLEVEQAGGRSL